MASIFPPEKKSARLSPHWTPSGGRSLLPPSSPECAYQSCVASPGTRWTWNEPKSVLCRGQIVSTSSDCPKSDAGQRTISIPPLVVTTLSEWKIRCPKGEHNLVFPNCCGNIQAGGNIVKRGFKPALIAAGIVREKVLTDKQHKAVLDEVESL